jgi:hypothetical protein
LLWELVLVGDSPVLLLALSAGGSSAAAMALASLISPVQVMPIACSF